MINNRGFVIKKQDLTQAQIKQIKNDLNVVPYSNYSTFQKKSIKAYTDDESDFILPIYYALNELKINDYKIEFKTPHSVNLSKDQINLRPNQVECYSTCIQEFSKPFGGGIINLTTGSGKTITAIKLITSINVKTLVVLNKIELLNQWKSELTKHIPNVRLGLIQGSFFDINTDIVLGMIQTITLKKTYVDYSWVGMMIIDECHNVGSEVFSKILSRIRPAYTFGLTATINRKDKLEQVIKWYIGDIIYSNTATDTKQPSEIMMYSYTGKSSVEKLLYNGTAAVSEMLSNIAEDTIRSDCIIDIIKNLDNERNILVISDRINLLKYINDKLPKISGLFIGGMKPEELQNSKEKRVLLGTYSLVNEGFNCVKLNTLVFATPRSNIVQSIGRIYRKHHDITPMIIDICDDFSLFKVQKYKRIKTYKECISKCKFTYNKLN